MANTATLIDTVPAQVGRLKPVYEYEVVIDTTGADLNVRAASATDKRIWVVGLLLSEATSGNLILKTATKTKTLELGANQGIFYEVSDSWSFATKPGETLIVQTSMACAFTLMLAEGELFNGSH
jgi:hypothetical protein